MSLHTQIPKQFRLDAVAPKSAVTAWLLWLFLGWFGAHRFYLERPTVWSVVMLVMTLSAVVLPTLPFVIVWWIIDALAMREWLRQV